MRADADRYIDTVLTRFAGTSPAITADITDRVFLMIEHDPGLRREYDELLASGISKRGLNAQLGKRVREQFHLRNIGRCHNRRSSLIKSYERHAK
jgi:hypothetical protein